MSDTANLIDPYTPRHGNPGYRVDSYFLDLTYRVSANRLSGTASIVIAATEPLRRVMFDLAGLAVSKVLVDGRPAKKFAVKSGKLTITLASALSVDRLVS